jgi:hypothetical protein
MPSHLDACFLFYFGSHSEVGPLFVIEDEHDVVWFKLKKGEQYECSVCTQVFQVI